jgi:uncharacterized membrane protein
MSIDPNKRSCESCLQPVDQFEEFPRFMEGVKEVQQLDDTHLHWKAEIGGQEKELNAEITE